MFENERVIYLICIGFFLMNGCKIDIKLKIVYKMLFYLFDFY